MNQYELTGYEDDGVGDDDGVGEDDGIGGAIDAALGAVRRRNRKVRRPGIPAPVKVQADREYWLPINAAVVAPGVPTTITTRPQATFRPKHFVIGTVYSTTGSTAYAAGVWVINDFRIGVRPQSVNAGSLPGDAFSNVAVGTGFKFDTAMVGVDITLVVTQNSLVNLPFAAVLTGDALHY